MRNRQENLGYTLTECLVAIAIVGILSAIALPSFANLMQRQQTQTTRDGIFSLVQNARTIALSNHRHVVLCGSADGVRCSSSLQWQQHMLSFEDRNRNRQPDGNDKMLVKIEIAPQITVHATRSMLVYRPDGTARGANLTIKVCSRSHRSAEGATVVVANSGRARMDRDECH